MFDPNYNQYTVKHPSADREFIFTAEADSDDPSHKLYRCDAIGTDDISGPEPLTGVARITVAELEKQYTKRQTDRAKEARKLSVTMGYPSDHSLAHMINTGGLLNSPVTAQDVQRAHELYPSVDALRGKTTRQASTPYREEPVHHLISAVITLSVDIIFVLSHAFLLSVGHPIAFTMVSHLGWELGACAKSAIRRALFEQFDRYKGHGLNVKYLHTDGEGAIASLSPRSPALTVSLSTQPDLGNMPKPLSARHVRSRSVLAASYKACRGSSPQDSWSGSFSTVLVRST